MQAKKRKNSVLIYSNKVKLTTNLPSNDENMLPAVQSDYPTLYAYFYKQINNINSSDSCWLDGLTRTEEGRAEVLGYFLQDADLHYLSTLLKPDKAFMNVLKGFLMREFEEVDSFAWRDREELAYQVWGQFKSEIVEVWNEAGKQFREETPIDNEWRFHNREV